VTEEQMALLRAEHILIERSNITLEDVIGQGHFGCVYRGKLYSPEKEIEREVAVKTLHSCKS
jgi:proto-oncogene tyrosine-protein kinase Met